MSPNHQNIEKTIPFLPLFLEEVKDQREAFLVTRRKLNRKIQLLIVGLALSFILVVGMSSIFLLSSGFIFIALFVGGLMVQQIRYAYLDRKKLATAFEQVFIDEVHTYITQNVQSSWVYDYNSKFRKKNLIESQIFHDNIKLEEISFSISGHFENIPLDIHKICLEIGDEGSNNNIYEGLFIELYFWDKEDTKTIITPRITYQNFNATSFHKLSLHQRGYQQYKETDLSFNKYFKVYNMEGHDLPSTLTLVRQRQLAHFVQYHKKQVYLSFQKNKLHISIRTDEPTLLPTLNSDLISAKEATESFYQDLQLCMDLLQRLQF